MVLTLERSGCRGSIGGSNWGVVEIASPETIPGQSDGNGGEKFPGFLRPLAEIDARQKK